jgi:uncharacterized protein (UPF0276 family)
LKLFPSNVVPLAIADIIHKLKFKSKSSRNQAHAFLKRISALWRKEEKEAFMRRVTSKECLLDLATVMCDISYKGFDLISTLSGEVANTIRLLHLRPDMSEGLMQLCGDMHGKPMEDKMEVLRMAKFTSMNFELATFL